MADANGKRKREGETDRRAAPKERRLRQREEEMEEEFAAAYHGPTSLYKLLEAKHLRCPLFLPRTLSYRLVAPATTTTTTNGKAEGKGESKANGIVHQQPPTAAASDADAAAAPGATLREFKIGMMAECIDHFKREGIRVGLLFSLYTAHGRAFRDNSFELVATCLVPVPCVKEARLPKQLARVRAEVTVVAVQVVRINDVVEKLMGETQYAFATPSAAADNDVKPVLGSELLRARVGGREPLFGSLLRVDMTRRRAGFFSMELPAIAPSMRGVVKMQFRLVWDKPVKTARMARLEKIAGSKWPAGFIDSKDDVGAALTVPKRVKPSPYTRRGKTQVWFHYLYHSMLRRMSEKRPDFSCAWCNLYAGSLKGLVAHLVSSHSRFRFHVSAGNDNVPHIYVMPRSMNGANGLTPSVRAAMCELSLDDDKDVDDRVEQHFMFISPWKRTSKSAPHPEIDRLPKLDELDELDDGADEQPQEFYAPLLQRQYFHSRTGAVVLDHEKDYDSDDDVDEEWITQQSERLLDEFEDVSLEEKEFMKKWNRHVKENRILADFMVASSCRLFAKRHGKWIIDSGLRYNFLLHLFNLWDNSLLNSRAIIDCMLIVDHYAVLEETKENETDADVAANAAPAMTTNGVAAVAGEAPSS